MQQRQQTPARGMRRAAPAPGAATAAVGSIGAMLLVSALAFAQEPEPTVQAPEAVAEEAQPSGSDNENGERANGDPGKEVFIPTEEISEDFAVSFPVDI